MTFKVSKTTDAERYFWHLEAADGLVAKSLDFFPSEAAARSDIARFKKAAGGVRYAKTIGAK